jgi:hypothetical protein
VARHRILQPATEGVAVDRGHHRLGAGVEHIIGPLPDRRSLAPGAEAADIRTGDETASVPHQHHRVDRRIGVRLVEAVDDPLRHARPERVHRRIVDNDNADVAVLFEADDGGV